MSELGISLDDVNLFKAYAGKEYRKDVEDDKKISDQLNKKFIPFFNSWGKSLVEQYFPGGTFLFDPKSTNPVRSGGLFKNYYWLQIFPMPANENLAFTLSFYPETGFEVRIDTFKCGTDEAPVSDKKKKEIRENYQAIRDTENSNIASALSIEEGLAMSMEKLVEWTISEFKKFTPTYEDICKKLGLEMVKNGQSDRRDTSSVNKLNHPLNQILFGPAGTGKTYNTINYALSILDGRNINDPQTENDRKIFKKYMDEGRVSFVTFHQSYGYEDFIEGIRVDKNDQDQLTYGVKSGVFQEICDRAIGKEAVEQDIDVVLDEFAAEIHNKNLKLSTKTGTEFTVLSKSGKDITVRTSTTNELYISKAAIKAYILEPSENIRQNQAYAWSIAKHLQNSRNILKPVVDSKTQPYVLIIDEINRGNISKIFGELITLIEDSKRAGNKEQLTLTLPSSNKPFSVPKNLYIIGTMNSSDRSLTSVDIALRRRFEFIEMQPQPKVLKDIDIKELGKNAVSNILEVMNKRIKVLLDRDHCIGHAYFTPLIEDPSLENLMHIFEKRIIPLLQEYFFDDWTKINLVLGENGMVHTMNLDSTLFLSMNPSEIEHLKKRNWDVNNYLFQDAPLAIKVNALKQIISPKQDYKIPKLENTVKEAS